MEIIQDLSQHLVPYITLNGMTGELYTYEKRFGNKRFPVIEHTMHQKKGSLGSILYMAVESGANLRTLTKKQKLYVGSQSGPDRMFRGDKLKGTNFHHAQMRDGHNGHSLERYMEEGGKVDIYAVPSVRLIALADTSSKYKPLLPMAKGIVTLPRGRDYAGYWFEQLILREELAQWAWNTKGIDADAKAIFVDHGI